jgi:hypothetical protein
VTSPHLSAVHHAPSPGDERLARALERAINGIEHESPELREAVRLYVAEAKARQAAPQEVLVSLKAVLHRVAMPRMVQGEFADLTARAVKWCIDDYYRPA